MNNNSDKKFYVDKAQNCCEIPSESCIPETLSSCGDDARQQYLCYLEAEKCKVEPDPTFSMCDWDPSEVYFMQYRSKKAFYNEWWKENLFDDIYNINAHKYNKGGN